MRKNIETTIEINAAPEKVWSVLANTGAYQDWNPYLQVLSGELKTGGRIVAKLTLPDGGKFVMKPTILNAEFPELRWVGKLPIPGLFDGEHYFRVEPIATGRSRFIHGENFSGILVGFVGGILKKTQNGFETMNRALKAEAERN